MTASIFTTLGMLPTGEPGVPLSIEEFTAYLQRTVRTDAEKARNARHALRDDLYRDGGDDHMLAVIADVFENRQVKEKRQRMIPHAKFSNCLKRIVGELSTVYAEPAIRKVGGDEANQARYAALVKAMGLDEQLGVVNEMLNLHRALIVGPRIRTNADGSREMTLDIATPSTVRALVLPHDKTCVVGWLIRVDMPLVRNPWGARPGWVLWTDHETMYLTDEFVPIEGSHVEHGIGMSRWVPINYSAVAIPGFWPGREGEDLVSARVTEWLADILMIKETKSNTKQPIISGDTTTMARAQAADSETPIEAPEGVSVSTVDMGTDPDMFIRASDHILERAGNNYGLSMAALKHQGVQSAEARELMLAPVRERRGKQEKIFRRFEERLAVVMAAVARQYAPELAFDPEGWRIDFGEIRVALSKKDRLDIYDRERKAGFTNPVAFMMEENPDLTAEQALDELVANVEVVTMHTELMRPLMAISGALGGNAARADGAPAGGRPPNDPSPTEPPTVVAGDPPDMSWVEEVVNAA